MRDAIKIGLNYTGTHMSPLDSELLTQAAEETPADVRGNESKLALVRTARASEAESVGSVPIPGSAKGMLNAALNKLASKNPEVLIDKLGERLAFERTGTRLYEAMLAKVAAIEDIAPELRTSLQQFRDEEAAHFKQVREALETLGADPTAQTPCADMAGVTSMGVLQVLTDPRTNLAQALNALLTAELTDNAGWELLIELANSLGHHQMAESFGQALAEEQFHLESVRIWLESEVLNQVQ